VGVGGATGAGGGGGGGGFEKNYYGKRGARDDERGKFDQWGNPIRERDDEPDWEERKQRACDFHNTALLDVGSRIRKKRMPALFGHKDYLRHMALPMTCLSDSSQGYNTRLTYVTKLKNSDAITCCCWAPGGRRLITGNVTGMMQFWDGNNFSFENIMTAHEDDNSFRCMVWSHNETQMLSCDSAGNINFYNKEIAISGSHNSHDGQPCNAVCFSPSDGKFASVGDDST